MEKRAKAFPTPKAIVRKIEAEDKKKQKENDPKEKPVSERYQRNEATITLVNVETGQRVQLTLYTSDRIGTLRQALVRMLNMKKSTPITFLRLNTSDLPPDLTPTVFLYTIGIRAGSSIYYRVGKNQTENAKPAANNPPAEDDDDEDDADDDTEDEEGDDTE